MLLQVVVEPSAPLIVQQSAAIYFKNQILNYWKENDEFTYNDQDKIFVRGHILEALVKCHQLHKYIIVH
jgi:hypothetical protein